MLFLSKDVHLLNMQNGLADNTVSAVYKDKEGFIWFGTRNGLSRYDGRRITNFERSRSYPSISNLKEVFDGVLAFVDNGVFSAFDLKKERFLSVVSSSGQGIPSRGMLQRNDSLVWVISGSELHLMKRCASKRVSFGSGFKKNIQAGITRIIFWLPSLILRIKKVSV